MYTIDTLPNNLPPVPRPIRKMTARQIIDYCWQHPDSKARQAMEKVFNAAHEPEVWKYPFYVRIVDRQYKELLKAAIIWYHGAQPYETMYGVGSYGYAAW